jgi:hypothetical protein
MTRVSWAAAEVWENHVDELNFQRIMYHLISGLYLCCMLYLLYWILPINGHWASGVARDGNTEPYTSLDMRK